MNSLEFAINMELDGEKYYLEQAERNQGVGLKSVFQILAEEERIHAKLLKNKANDLPYELNDTFSELKNVFMGMDNFDHSKQTPEALNIYRIALEKEKESINLYQKCLSESTDAEEKELFEYLIKQEEDHYEILEDLIELINRPKEWIESAEFGVREEY